jgi:radical SAM-linked protein
MTQRDIGAALDDLLVRSGLPLVPAGRYRSRITFALPLPVGVEGEREPAELYLAARTPVHRVRDALAANLPAGVELVELFDVWLGEASLIGRVTGADYRVVLRNEVDASALAAAAAALVAATALPRERRKGGGVVRYDLRPLLEDVSVESSPDRPGRPVVRTRVRVRPEHGSGRPDEVLAALADRVGRELDVERIVREGVLLGDE